MTKKQPSLTFLRTSRALWRRRELYRRGRHEAWKRAGDKELTAKWKRLYDEAKEQRKLRDRQLASRKPKLTDTVTVTGTPTFRGIAFVLEDARRHGWRGSLSSSDRRKGVAERFGKMSQAALYAGWIAGKIGFNPANKPGRSTHELRSDGVAYRGPVGRPLLWWQIGLDVTDSDKLVPILRSLGYDVFRPYSSGSERHHINFRKSPTKVLRRRGMA